MKKLKVYVGCSLTHASDEYRESIENLKNSLRNDFEILDFMDIYKDKDPKKVFEHDYKCLVECDFMIADCSEPSTGLGFEIATVLGLKKPVYAFASVNSLVSNFIIGITNPNFKFMRYKKLDEIVNLVLDGRTT